MSNAFAIRVAFNHCDLAGIGFYPRHFKMTGAVCGNVFRDAVGYFCATMMDRGIAMPTARDKTDAICAALVAHQEER